MKPKKKARSKPRAGEVLRKETLRKAFEAAKAASFDIEKMVAWNTGWEMYITLSSLKELLL